MENGSASKTALGAATLRAAHQLIDGDVKLLNDPVILELIDPETRSRICENADNFNSPGTLGMRTHIVLRSRYAEDCLKQAYEKGVRQFIILGAGLDTFAYRQPAWASGLKIFEADHLSSQAEKLDKLIKAGIAIPPNVSFINVNLETDDLESTFTNFINFEEPVFTACLGVLIYLTQSCVNKIFQFLGGFSEGSEFIFTVSQKRNDKYAEMTSQKVAEEGEPWISYFEPEALIEQLKNNGFTFAEYLSPEDAYELYFNNHDIRLPPPSKKNIVRAVI